MKQSAGILLYRIKKTIEIFLVHPGGPYWKNKDIGAWSIPKGEFADGENALAAAQREFEEETGLICRGPFIELSAIKQKSGKMVYAWAVKQDFAADKLKSNTFEMEWPPKSGKTASFPEIDKGRWFSLEEAKLKIIPAQVNFIDELTDQLNLTE